MKRDKRRGNSMVAVLGLIGVMATLTLAVLSLKSSSQADQQKAQQLKLDYMSAVNIGSATLRDGGTPPQQVAVGSKLVALTSTYNAAHDKVTLVAGEGAAQVQAFATREPVDVALAGAQLTAEQQALLAAGKPDIGWVVRDANNAVISKASQAKAQVEAQAVASDLKSKNVQQLQDWISAHAGDPKAQLWSKMIAEATPVQTQPPAPTHTETQQPQQPQQQTETEPAPAQPTAQAPNLADQLGKIQATGTATNQTAVDKMALLQQMMQQVQQTAGAQVAGGAEAAGSKMKATRF